ncbi:MAG: hypothetical protein KA974_05935 [Saprospiraceae bacterium]|nr:hypothetical protein [Saprospiraceae bacterium]
MIKYYFLIAILLFNTNIIRAQDDVVEFKSRTGSYEIYGGFRNGYMLSAEEATNTVSPSTSPLLGLGIEFKTKMEIVSFRFVAEYWRKEVPEKVFAEYLSFPIIWQWNVFENNRISLQADMAMSFDAVIHQRKILNYPANLSKLNIGGFLGANVAVRVTNRQVLKLFARYGRELNERNVLPGVRIDEIKYLYIDGGIALQHFF